MLRWDKTKRKVSTVPLELEKEESSALLCKNWSITHPCFRHPQRLIPNYEIRSYRVPCLPAGLKLTHIPQTLRKMCNACAWRVLFRIGAALTGCTAFSLKRLYWNDQISIHLYQHPDTRSARSQWAGTMFFILQHPETILKDAWPLIMRKQIRFKSTTLQSKYFQSGNQKTKNLWTHLLWKSAGKKKSIIGSEFERNNRCLNHYLKEVHVLT